MKALDLSGKDETAPFVQYKMILGWDGTMEQNYSYFADAQCTKRRSQKREYAKYTVIKSSSRKATLAVRKDMGDGIIHQSVIEIDLPRINGMQVKTLSSKVEIDDLLSDNPMDGVDKNSGSGEPAKSLSRHTDSRKSDAKL